MKNSIIVASLLFWTLMAFFLGMNVAEKTTTITQIDDSQNQIWADHYVCSEHLLDILDKKYHWTDAIDHQGYYETREEVEYHFEGYIKTSQEQFNKVLEWENQQNK